MLKLKITTTKPLPIKLKGRTLGTYLKNIEDEHNVTIFTYDHKKSLIAYTGEYEAIHRFLNKGLRLSFDEVDDAIATSKKALPPLWNLFNFSDLLRMNEWDYTMTRLEGHVAPYQYKMKYSKKVNGKTLVVKIPWMSHQPEINIYKEQNGQLIPLATFGSTETYLPFQDAIECLNDLLKDLKNQSK
jgi:hypothetical protein